MPHKPVIIQMDNREDHSGIGGILAREENVNVIRKHLSVGDYIVNETVVIERKTGQDFVQSIIDGRLFKQAAGMKRYFDVSAIIIEGQDLYRTGIQIHPHAIKGALGCLGLIWQMPVFFTDDPQDTAGTLILIGRQIRKTCHGLSCRRGRRPKRLRRRQIYILQGLPQVGPLLARHLLDHFGSVEKVIMASEKELMQVAGLGRGKAKTIRHVLSH